MSYVDQKVPNRRFREDDSKVNNIWNKERLAIREGKNPFVPIGLTVDSKGRIFHLFGSTFRQTERSETQDTL